MEDLDELARGVANCQRCSLYENSTQAVFGEGPADAALMLVGETPGDYEDKQGHPFVGPAGRVLNRALSDSGIDRSAVYLTNAVKHFKWRPQGKRRIHQRPNGSEIRACRPWVAGELSAVSPRVVVLLGAVAGESFYGSSFRVGARRGHPDPLTSGAWSGLVVATIHPSAVLRASDEDRPETYDGFVADLKVAASAVAAQP
jgi:uracil-DNA glycosylase